LGHFVPAQRLWIDRLAFQGQDTEGALVDAAERLTADEALQTLDTKRELA
jgi:hypothetical protein